MLIKTNERSVPPVEQAKTMDSESIKGESQTSRR
jgi:hypothetical protein